MSIHRTVHPLAAAAILLLPITVQAQTATQTRLTLGDAARQAANRNQSTVAARERAAQADAQAAQKRADLLPSLTTTMQAGARTFNTASLGLDFPAPSGQRPPFDANGEVVGPVHSVDARAHLSQTIFDAPSMLRWRSTSATADGAHYAAGASAEAAGRRGAIAYLAVLRAESRIAARSADSALAAELLDIARQQVRAGVGVSLDVTRAEAQLAETHAHLIIARSERERSLLDLRRELSLAFDTPLELTDSLGISADEPVPSSDDDALRIAIDRRAELREAAAETDAAKLSDRAAFAERLPVVSLFADQGTMGKNTDRLLGTYAYGVQVSLPLFDGLRIESRKAEERARVRESEARAQDVKRSVETEVRSARLDLVAQREAVVAARSRLRLAEQEVSQARERFRAGVSSNADVISASIALNGARDLVIDALTAFHSARVSFAAAQGEVTSMK